MLDDIVIDTNVLLHAQNPKQARFDDSNKLLQMFLTKNTKLCVDAGFTVNEADNESKIGAEYLEKIKVGTFAYAVIVELSITMRVKEVNRLPPNRLRRKVNQMIRKPRDRTFLGVAINSDNNILVSHDYEDFQEDKRITIRRELEVQIIEACDCLPLL